MTSVLTNDLVKDKNGSAYVSNISGKSGNVINYVFDPQTNFYKPQLTADQEKAARDYMRRKIEQRLDIKIKEDPFNKPVPKVPETTAPSGPPIDVQGTYLSRVKQKTGLSENTFTNSGSQTASNMQSIIARAVPGTPINVVTDERIDGLVHMKSGDQIIKSFNVKGINAPTQQAYLNEFTEIISNLAGTDGMIDYLSRTGGIQQSGGLNYSNF
jgi:hypothetical protein